MRSYWIEIVFALIFFFIGLMGGIKLVQMQAIKAGAAEYTPSGEFRWIGGEG